MFMPGKLCARFLYVNSSWVFDAFVPSTELRRITAALMLTLNILVNILVYFDASTFITALSKYLMDILDMKH